MPLFVQPGNGTRRRVGWRLAGVRALLGLILGVGCTAPAAAQIGYGREAIEARAAEARRDSVRIVGEAAAAATHAIQALQDQVDALAPDPPVEEPWTPKPSPTPPQTVSPAPGAAETASPVSRSTTASAPGEPGTSSPAPVRSRRPDAAPGSELFPAPGVQPRAPGAPDSLAAQPSPSPEPDVDWVPAPDDQPRIRGRDRNFDDALDDLVPPGRRLVSATLLRQPDENRLRERPALLPPDAASPADTTEAARAASFLWGFRPQGRLVERRAGLFARGVPEVAADFYLDVQPGERRSAIDLDLEAGTVSRAVRIGEVEVEPAVPAAVESHVQDVVVSGRWVDWSRTARSAVGRTLNESAPIGLRGEGVSLSTAIPEVEVLKSIIGESKAEINIRGTEVITVGGTSNWDANLTETDTASQSKFPQLDLRQDLNIQVDGQVGDKVTIDWRENTGAETSLANRISIRYRGYEDEVVKTVDLGNTSLSLPGTGFVSYNGSHSGLFGVKSTAQLGDFDLTVIASKEEGQTASASINQGVEESVRRLHELNYVKRRFFFLVDPVDPKNTGLLLEPGAPGWVPPPEISDLKVWLDDRNQHNNGGLRPGTMYLDPAPEAVATAEDSIPDGVFDILVSPTDYRLRTDLFSIVDQEGQAYNYPVLDLHRVGLDRDDYLGVTFKATYRTPGGGQEVVTYGSVPSEPNAPLILKALQVPPAKIQTDQDFFIEDEFWAPTLRLALKNIYDLGGSEIDPASLVISLHSDLGAEPEFLGDDATTTFIRMLGVDRESVNGFDGFDNIIDQVYLKLGEGLMVLPDLRPFAPSRLDSVWPFYYGDLQRPAADPRGRPAFFVDGAANRAAYDKRNPNTGQDSRYYFEIKSRSRQNTEFFLTASGSIIEDSESVIVNGQRLSRGQDYSIDYDTGRVNITKADLPSDADVQIDYAFAPLFQLGQKTLMGTHVGWKPDERRRLGATFLFESSGVADRRPKLGEEPSRILIGDVNGSFKFEPVWMNRLVEGLPAVRASGDSRLELSGELAASAPNPNTRGQVYLDDFEGAKETSILSIHREQWFWAAQPVAVETADDQSRRGDLLWYNPVRSPTFEGDLFPELDELEANDRRQILMLRVQPRDLPGVQPEEQWVGLSQGISSSGADFNRKQFIEVWLNDLRADWVRNPPPGVARPTMHVDLGNISEDAEWNPLEPPNDRRDTEDLNADGVLDLNDTVFEDTGLDGMLSASEIGPGPPSDPANDDFAFDRDRGDDPFAFEAYQAINRTEGNRKLDDEDLNRDNAFQGSAANDYLTFSVDLSDTTYVAADVERDFGLMVDRDGRPNGWRLFRIPIEVGEPVGTPSLSNVTHCRIWFTGLPDTTTVLQLAGIDVQGNLYETEPLRDAATGLVAEPNPGESVTIRGINNKEDANEYTAPFDLEERDRVTEREGSLAFDFVDLAPGREGSALRAFSSERDFTLYDTLTWYLYQGLAANSITDPVEGMEAFVRFGADTLNYYEYSVLLDRQTPGWLEVDVPVAEISALKLAALGDSTHAETTAGRTIKFVGNPSFTKISRLTFGVRNASTAVKSGTIWVDDIRLDDVIRDLGTAARFGLSAKFADFLDVNSDLSTEDEDFLSIGSAGRQQISRGTGSSSRRFNLRSTAQLHKFFETTGINLPVSFSFQDNLSLPEFSAGDDIVLNPDQSRNQQTGSKSVGYTARFSRRREDSSPWVRQTLNALAMDYSLRDSRSLGKTSRDSSRSINFNASYAPVITVEPLALGPTEFRYVPESVNARLAFRSDRRFTYQRDLEDPTVRQLQSVSYLRVADLSAGTSYSPFRSLRGDYNVTSSRDLVAENPASWLFGLNIGSESTRGHRVGLNWDPPGFYAPSFSFRSDSNDNHAPRIQRADVDGQLRHLNASQNLSGSWSIPLTLVTGGRSRAPADSVDNIWRDVRAAVARVGVFQDIAVSAAINRNNSLTDVVGVPRWQYQLGFSLHPGADVRQTSLGVESETESRNLSLSSGAQLTGGIDLRTSFAVRRSRSLRTAAVTRIDVTRTWPDIKLNWRQLHRKNRFLTRAFRSLALDSGFRHERTVSGPDFFRDERTTRRSEWRPLFNLNGTFQSSWTSQVRMDVSSTRDDDVLTGQARSRHSDRSDFKISFGRRYQKGAIFKLPWQKQGKKLNGPLQLSFDVDRKSDATESREADGRTILEQKIVSMNFRGSATYSFRRQIDARLSAAHTRRNDVKLGYKRRSITMSMAMTFTF